MKEFKDEIPHWEIMEDDDEMKIIESGSLEKGHGWHSYIKVCGDVDDVKNANIIAAAPEFLEALQAALEWIDSVPQYVQLPTMPGFDRDWVDGIINKALGIKK